MRTNFAVGLFVITGIAIAAAIIIYVGASSYFSSGDIHVAYFDESVQGLSKDSPVKYRGVSVGQVQDIRIAKDARLIEVVLRIDSGWQVRKNVFAQLKSIGLTGLMFVELDLQEAVEEKGDLLQPGPETPSRHPVIPTKSSEIQKILDGLAEIVQQMETLDLPGISDRLKNTIDTVNDTVHKLDTESISAQLTAAVKKADKTFATAKWHTALSSIEKAGNQFSAFVEEASTTTEHVNTLITDNRDRLQEAIVQLQLAINQANRLMQNSAAIAGTATDSIHRIEHQLAGTIRNLEAASRQLNRLTDKSALHPAQLFFAAPPPAKPIEDEK